MLVHAVRGTRGEGLGAAGGGGADLCGFLPLSALTACLPHSRSAFCWRLAPACCWRAAPSLPAAPTHRGRESGGRSGPPRQGAQETMGGREAKLRAPRKPRPQGQAPGGGRRVLGWLGALRPSTLLASGFCGEMTSSEVFLFLSLQPEDHSLTLS